MQVGSFKDLEKITRDYRKKLYYPGGIKVNIGMASCGIAAGAKASFEKALERFPQGNGTKISQTFGCSHDSGLL